MSIISTVTVTVPATTANLGPGFDCIGAALTLYNHFNFSLLQEAETLRITATGTEAAKVKTDDSNLAYQAFVKLYEYLGQSPPSVAIEISLGVPLARGLGSSATAIAGGLVGANYLAGEPLTPVEVMQLAIAIEGHPDNVVPALFGGCRLAATKGEPPQPPLSKGGLNAEVIESPLSKGGLNSESPLSKGGLNSEPPLSKGGLNSEPPLSKGELNSEPPLSKGGLNSEPPLSKGGLNSEPPLSKGGQGGCNWEICDIPWHSDIVPIVAIPDFELSTAEARKVLPTEYSKADAIFNAAHLGLLVRGLATGNADWLRSAMQDKIHQPYRQSLIKGYSAVREAAIAAGAYEMVISGAGPTLLALATREVATAVAAAMADAWQQEGAIAQVRSLSLDTQGATISV
ncbi:homoserine kinase [Kamptonema formosum]|uniref:homoserine kinase n=1 Tax=Kamptonema formosum TaxID=331992 RepID=UPI00035FB04C|nr:homoserine kinase [Kamptonema formosum]